MDYVIEPNGSNILKSSITFAYWRWAYETHKIVRNMHTIYGTWVGWIEGRKNLKCLKRLKVYCISYQLPLWWRLIKCSQYVYCRSIHFWNIIITRWALIFYATHMTLVRGIFVKHCIHWLHNNCANLYFEHCLILIRGPKFGEFVAEIRFITEKHKM